MKLTLRGDRHGVATAMLALFLAFPVLAWGVSSNAQPVVVRNSPAQGTPLLMLFELHRKAGRSTEALAALERLDGVLAPADLRRSELADAYSRLGRLHQALAVLEGLALHNNGLDYENKARLARLLETLGRKDQALATWKSLWVGVTAPARRSLIESRMLALADEAQGLDSLANELRARLANGKAQPDVASLLIRVLAQLGDKAGALDVADKHLAIPGDEVSSLQIQARVHRALNDHAGFERVTRRLAEVDARNRARHLRDLILNEVDHDGEDRLTEIRQLLARLREVDPESMRNEFEGGVLALADLRDEAVVAYRRSLAARPGDGDTYLLLGDVLTKQRRVDEAVGLFSDLIERAGDDATFLLAMDGLLNSMALPEEALLEKRSGAILKWGHGRLLERLVLRGDALYLFSVLGNFDQALSETDRWLNTLDASLVPLAARRSSVLRELIVLTAAPSMEDDPGSRRQHLEDSGRRIAYARRLAALREALPPDVYVSLGKDMLRNADEHGAALAFERAEDLAGSSGVRVQAGDLLVSAGRDEAARREFELAWISDQRNVGLLLRLARLHERMRRDPRANDLYAKGLLQVLGQLSPRAPAAGPSAAQNSDSVVTYDYRQYYEELLRGYLATCGADSGALLTELSKAIDQELEAAPSGELKSHVRLDYLARTMRRVAFATGRATVADHVDARLLVQFHADDSLAPLVVRERVPWGRAVDNPGGVKRPGALSDRERLDDFVAVLAQAEWSGSFREARNLSAVSENQAQMLSVARAWAKSGDHIAAIRWAQGRLDRESYLRLCREALRKLRDDRPALEDMLIQHADFLADIEAATGERAVSEARLLKTVTDPRTATSAWYAAPAWPYIIGRFSPQSRLAWAQNVVESRPLGDALDIVLEIWRRSLAEPMPADFAARFTDLLLPQLRKLVATPTPYDRKAGMLAQLTPTKLHMENAAWLRKVVDYWRHEWREPVDFFEPQYLLVQGRTSEAIDAFIALNLQIEPRLHDRAFIGSNYEILRAYQVAFLPEHAAQIEQRLIAAARLDPRAEYIRYWLFHSTAAFISGERGPPRDLRAFLEGASAAQPENLEYLSGLAAQYYGLGLPYLERDTLRRRAAISTDNIAYRAALFYALRDLDAPFEALRLNESAAQDMRGPPFLTSVLKRQGQGEFMDLVHLPPPPGPQVVPVSAFRIVTGRSDIIRALDAGDVATATSSMRALWQSVPGEVELSYGDILTLDRLRESTVALEPPSDLLALIRRLDQPAASHPLFRELIDAGMPASELENQLRALDVDEWRNLPVLCAFLTEAYRHEGTAAARMVSLGEKIRDGRAQSHELSVWLTLAAQAPGSLPTGTAAILDELLERPGGLHSYQQLMMARIAAHMGLERRAAEIYRLYATGTLFATPSEPSFEDRTFGREFRGMTTALALVEEIARNLGGSDRAVLLGDILRLVRPDAADKSLVKLNYERFAMLAWSRVLDPQAALARATREIGFPDAGWPVENLAVFSALQQRAEETAAALATIRLALQPDPQEMGIGADAGDNPEMLGTYQAMLGLPVWRGREDFVALFTEVISGSKLSVVDQGNWRRAAADVLKQWVTEPGISVMQCLDLMLIVAFRAHQHGDSRTLAAAMRDVSAVLAAGNRYPRVVVSRVLTMSQELRRPLELPAMQRLMRDGRLDAGQMVATIRRTADAEGKARALDLGLHSAQYTQNDALLAALVTLAMEHGDPALAARLQEQRQAAAAARRQL